MRIRKVLEICSSWIVVLFTHLDMYAQQPIPLDSILARIERNHPALKAPDARIRELDTYAKGTVTLPPPRVSSGFWMTPYNPKMWSEGMGAFMLSGEQSLQFKDDVRHWHWQRHA